MFARRLAQVLGAKLAQRAGRAGWAGLVVEGAAQRQACRSYATDYRGYEHFRDRRPPWQRPWQQLPPRQAQVIVLVAGGAAVAYYVSRQEVPYTHRRHAVFVSTALEQRMGESQFQQIKAQAAAAGTLLPPVHPVSRLVRHVGSRISAKATDGTGGGFQEHLKGLKWEFVVIRDDTANAFVLPGGKVVFTGILKLIDLEDELAAVLGHETGHVVARHAAERMSGLALAELLRAGLLFLLGLDIPPLITALVFQLPNSRRQEEEADIIGMDLAARACYEPGAAMTLFTKLGEYERRHGVHVPKFLSTHPLSEERVKKLAQHLPAARHVAELEGCQLPDENVTAELLPVGALGAAPALGPAPKAPPDASDPFAWQAAPRGGPGGGAAVKSGGRGSWDLFC